MTARLQDACDLIGMAEKWESNGDQARAWRCYETALNDLMFLAISDAEDVGAVSGWLGSHPFDTATTRYFDLASELLADGPPHWIESFRDNHYTLFAYGHFFAALGQHDRTAFLLRNAFESRGKSTPFWSEYRDAMRAMLNRQVYTPGFVRLNGLEIHWKHYVDLMGIVTRGDDREAVLSEIDDSFAARNRDKRLNGIGVLDGSGHFPVRFDFRKAGLLATISHEGL